LNKLYR